MEEVYVFTALTITHTFDPSTYAHVKLLIFILNHVPRPHLQLVL